MDLKDLIDPKYGLQQNEWSLTAPTFGKDNQLTVVGWSGSVGTAKYYILACNTCGQDVELFGEGYFRSTKSDLVVGKVPCGCSKRTRWSKDQYSVLCHRKATELGYSFLGFVGEWRDKNTRIKMLCEKHGEWMSGTVHTLISKSAGCPRCRTDAAVEATTKPDDIMIDSFHKSGCFHPDTKFCRSDKKNNKGWKVNWLVYCPECNGEGESRSGDLQKGCRPCDCNKHRQQECYINWLLDDFNHAVAVKFGIAIDRNKRIKDQDRQSVYTLKQHSVYTFTDVVSCKKAERECKQELECGVVLKRDMPDGYTETTWVYNLEKIIEIYERNGGILNDRQ